MADFLAVSGVEEALMTVPKQISCQFLKKVGIHRAYEWNGISIFSIE
ncbi:hypothetical protein [Kerstersia similis]